MTTETKKIEEVLDKILKILQDYKNNIKQDYKNNIKQDYKNNIKQDYKNNIKSNDKKVDIDMFNRIVTNCDLLNKTLKKNKNLSGNKFTEPGLKQVSKNFDKFLSDAYEKYNDITYSLMEEYISTMEDIDDLNLVDYIPNDLLNFYELILEELSD